MWMFLCTLILFFMLVPATLSVILASRSIGLLLWNMVWYLIISWFGQQVFGPRGVWVGGFFAILYVYKMLTRPVPSVQFQMKTFASTNGFKSYRNPTPANPANENVIEAQYTHIEPPKGQFTERT